MGEKKHLFGSTEKSDFILNMTEQGTKKLCGIYCMIAMLVVALAAIPYYLTKNIVDYVSTETGFEVTHYLSEKLVFLVSTLFYCRRTYRLSDFSCRSYQAGGNNKKSTRLCSGSQDLLQSA